MSETLTNVAEQLVNITVPNLNEAGYASQLSRTFDDINTNFIKLANRDFVKGENGDSVKIREVNLIVPEGETNAGQLTVFGQLLVDSIYASSNDENELADIICEDGSVLKWTDYLYKNPGKLYVIYDSSAVTFDEDVAYSSLYYTFLDGRYVNSKIGGLDPKTYELTKDMSCIAIYDKELNNGVGGFNLLQNAFPTIYYEEGVGLCWKVNGAGTGMAVQGIPGKPGNNASMYLVQATITPSTGLGDASDGKVLKIFEAYYGYKEIDETFDIYKCNDSPALILAANTDGSAGKDFYFGTLRVENHNGKDTLWAYCSPSSSITNSISEESFINSMKRIDILGTADSGSSVPKGLFIPMDDEKIDAVTGKDVQPVHFMSATSITNDEGSNSNLKTDIIFTPVNDYNSVMIDSEADSTNIMVNKYLYVKLDKDNNVFNYIDYDFKYNGVLKYRLDSIVSFAQASDFDTYNPSNTNDVSSGSRCFKSGYNDSNIKYYDFVNNTWCDGVTNDKSNHFNSFLSPFRKAINNGIGIFKWKLCVEANTWDVDELLEANPTGLDYTFPQEFRYIYTTEITPGANTYFAWFNGYEFSVQGINPENDTKYPSKTAVSGWYTENIMSFVKFVPIYTNTYGENISDTSLNLNYNINITGDKNNPNKSITVHGNVNCDNLSVYRLTATGAIQNIYTDDKIIGTRGIALCNNNPDDNNEYDFIVEDSGEVIAKKGVRSTSINCTKLEYNADTDDYYSETQSEEGTVTSNHVKTDDIVTKSVIISPASNSEASLKIESSTSKNSLSDIAELGITVDYVNDININSVDYPYGESYKDNNTTPVMTSDLPVNIMGNGNIIVSNQPKGSNELYFRDVRKDIPGEANKYAGDGVNVDTIDFESARNFNLHRLYANSSGGGSENVSIYGTSLSANSQTSGVYKSIVYKTSTSAVSSMEASSSNVDSNYISNSYLQKYSISNTQSGKYNGLDASKTITITFNKDFMFHIAINGKCDNGRWPVLWDSSKLNLSLWAQTSKSGVIDLGISETYNIDYTTNNSKNDNGFGWVGYKSDGTSYAEDNYDFNMRYYTYKFRPKSITISGNALKTIISKLASDEVLDLYVVATAELKTVGQNAVKVLGIGGNPKEVIKGLWMSCPRPIDEANITAGTSTKKQKTATKVNFSPASSSDKKVSTLKLTYKLATSTGGNVKTTTICNDGIVMRAGNYTFGLGYASGVNHNKYSSNTLTGYTMTNGMWPENMYSARPVLFYYDSSIIAQYPNTASSVSTTDTGYAKRVNSIPLDELFNTIKYLRESESFVFGI